MDQLEHVINEAIESKKSAKISKKFGDMENAETDALDAIETLEKYAKQDPALSEKRLDRWRKELSDCLGVLGGIYRAWAIAEEDPALRQERFKKSYTRYDEGYELERQLGIPNSYNRLNRLISRIFFEPSAFPDQSIAGVNIKEELEISHNSILAQLNADRKKDVWALADLALIRILLNKEDPITAYSRFVDEAPIRDAYESTLNTIEPLSQLEMPVRQNLRTAVNFLKERMPH